MQRRGFTNLIHRFRRFLLLSYIVTSSLLLLQCYLQGQCPSYPSLWSIPLPDSKPSSKIFQHHSQHHFLHQTWKSRTLPPRFQKWSSTWTTCFPQWRHILWTDDDLQHLVQTHYPWFMDTYRSLPRTIQQVDAARYLILFHYGGIYADLDTECVRPFPHLLNDSHIVMGAMEGHFSDEMNLPEGYVQNSFLYSPPRHPFWLEVVASIARTVAAAKESPEILNAVESLTGPLRLMEAVKAFRKRLPRDIIIYPPRYFNPFSWITIPVGHPCKTLNDMSERDLETCRAFYEANSYVIQYHTQTWRYGKAL